MPRDCSICTDDRLPEIGRAIGSGESNRSVADRFPGLTAASVQRHKVRHMGKSGPPKGPNNATGGNNRRAARFASSVTGRCPTCEQLTGDSSEALSPEAIIKRAERVLFISESIAAKAEQADDARLALQAVDRCQRALEGLMKATGIIGADVTVNVNNRQQNAFIDWKTDDLKALDAFYKTIQGGGSVQDAISAVVALDQPALSA